MNLGDRAVDLNAFLTKWWQRAVLDRQCVLEP